jgi:hypothetical protein
MKRPNLTSQQGILLILVFTPLILCPFQVAYAQGSSNTTVAVKPSTTMTRIGETIAINITLSNVQNLYGLDVTLQWNTSALKVLNVNLRLGVESHSDGVLHEASNANIFVKENTASQELGEYHLVATSVAPAPPFSGSGNIAIITFNVTSIGHSELDLTTELADYPPPDRDPRVSLAIQHTDVGASVDSAIPEFPNIAVFALFLILATFALVISKKLLKKNLSEKTILTQNS